MRRIRINDQVKLDDSRTGVIRYIGEELMEPEEQARQKGQDRGKWDNEPEVPEKNRLPISESKLKSNEEIKVKFARGEWCGLQLNPKYAGRHDGKVQGERYFTCPANQGAFVKKEKIVEIDSSWQSKQARARVKGGSKTPTHTYLKSSKSRLKAIEDDRDHLLQKCSDLEETLQNTLADQKIQLEDYQSRMQEAEKQAELAKQTSAQVSQQLTEVLEKNESEKFTTKEKINNLELKLGHAEFQARRSNELLNNEQELLEQEKKKNQDYLKEFSRRTAEFEDNRQLLEKAVMEKQGELDEMNSKVLMAERKAEDLRSKGEENASLRQAIQQAWEEVAKVKAQMAQERQEKTEKDREVMNVEGQLHAAQQRYKEIEDKLTQRSAQAGADALLIHQYRIQIAELKAKEEKHKNEVDERVVDLQQKLAEKTNRAAAVERALELVREEIKRLQQNYHFKMKENEKRVSQAKEAGGKEVEDIKKELKRAVSGQLAAEEKLSDAEEHARKGQDLVNKERELFLQEKEEHQQMKKDLIHQVKNLEKDNNEKDILVKSLQEKCEAQQEELSSLIETYASGNEEHSTLKVEHDQALEELTNFKVSLESETRRRQEVEKELEKYESLLIVAQNKSLESEKKLAQTAAKCEADAKVSLQDREHIKELEDLLKKERADVKAQIWVTKKYSESLRVLEEQRKHEIKAARMELDKQRRLLLQEREEQRRLVEREREEILNQREEIRNEKKMIEQQRRFKAKKRRKKKSSMAPPGALMSPRRKTRGQSKGSRFFEANDLEGFSITSPRVLYDPCLGSSDSSFFEFDKSSDDEGIENFELNNFASGGLKDLEIAVESDAPLERRSISRNLRATKSLRSMEFFERKRNKTKEKSYIGSQTMRIRPNIYDRHSKLSVGGAHSVISSAASIYLEVDPKEQFETDFKKIEGSVREMKAWVTKTKDSIALLPKEPNTFDEIWATIDPDRTKKLKEQIVLIQKLIDKSNKLTEENEPIVRDHFSDRTWALVLLEKECNRELKKIERVLEGKIGNAAYQFKKLLPQLLREYWESGKQVREVLELVQSRCEDEIPEDLENALDALKDTSRDEVKLARLKDQTIYLKRMGDIFGKIQSNETQECRLDSVDLELLYKSNVRSLARRTRLLRLRINSPSEVGA